MFFALSSILDEHNMDVVIARNGVEALEKLKEVEHVDAILMDIMMPVMDGYEAMREIRKMKAFAKMPIIAPDGQGHEGGQEQVHRGRCQRLPCQACEIQKN